MAKIYEACYYGGMIAAILLFVVAIILFFVLKIPKVFGELTGSTARRGVKDLKQKGSRSKESNEPKHYSQRTGAIRTRTSDVGSGELSKKENTTSGLIRGRKNSYHKDENQTEFLGESKITAAVTGDISETAVLTKNDMEIAEFEFINTDNLKSEAKENNTFTETSTDEVAAEKKPEDAKSVDDNNADSVSAEQVDAINDDAEDEATEVLTDDQADEDEATEVLTDDQSDEDEATEVLTDNQADEDEATEVLTDDQADEDEATEVLASDDQDDEDEATEVLTSNDQDEDEATAVLTSDDQDDGEATAVLTSGDAIGEYGETSVLTVTESKAKPKNYVVLYNVLEVHTSERL